MKLVNAPGRLETVLQRAMLHPLAVAPGVVQVPHHGGGIGRALPAKGEGIALGDLIIATMRGNEIFVDSAVAESADESFPDAGAVIAETQRTAPRVPVVEIAHHRNRPGVRRPHRE